MTDRIHSFTVVLEEDIRDDDAKALMEAIGCLKKVISVGANVSDATSYMAEERSKIKLYKEVHRLIQELTS